MAILNIIHFCNPDSDLESDIDFHFIPEDAKTPIPMNAAIKCEPFDDIIHDTTNAMHKSNVEQVKNMQQSLSDGFLHSGI